MPLAPNDLRAAHWSDLLACAQQGDPGRLASELRRADAGAVPLEVRAWLADVIEGRTRVRRSGRRIDKTEVSTLRNQYVLGRACLKLPEARLVEALGRQYALSVTQVREIVGADTRRRAKAMMRAQNSGEPQTTGTRRRR